jgi:hypothetical protein
MIREERRKDNPTTCMLSSSSSQHDLQSTQLRTPPSHRLCSIYYLFIYNRQGQSPLTYSLCNIRLSHSRSRSRSRGFHNPAHSLHSVSDLPEFRLHHLDPGRCGYACMHFIYLKNSCLLNVMSCNAVSCKGTEHAKYNTYRPVDLPSVHCG